MEKRRIKEEPSAEDLKKAKKATRIINWVMAILILLPLVLYVLVGVEWE